MFDKPVVIPDSVSTLELSKLWIYKALKNFEQELEAERLATQDETAESTEEQGQEG